MTRKNISEHGLIQDRDNGPLYSVGLNYWPRATGPLMWSRWDAGRIERELEQIAALGINTLRYFLYWPDFMPAPNFLDPEVLTRLDQFDSLCTEYGLFTYPSFFVGHMSGEDWDVPWRGGRDFYTDPWMLEQETWYIRQIVNRLLESENIAGWLLSNELPNYAGAGSGAEVTAWTRRMVEAIRTIDPDRLVSIGDGCWTPELYGKDSGYRLRDLAGIIDFAGPHFYHEYDDELRHSVLPGFVTQGSRQFVEPSIIEEFGCSNSMASPENQAAYYRNVLYTSLMAGAKGAWAWCYSDFDLPEQRPYSHHGHEFYFGITTAEGEVKPSGNEMRRFSRMTRELNLASCRRMPDQARVLIPSYYYFDYPYIWDDREQLFRVYLQTFAMLIKSGLNPGILYEPVSDFIRIESDEIPRIPDDVNIIYAPYHRKLTAQFQEALLNWIEKGGIFYASFGQSPWWHYFERFFGLEHHLRFGLTERPDDERISVTFLTSLGDIESGESIELRIAGSYQQSGYCPVEATHAEVLAVDQWENPVLTRCKTGQGYSYFSTYPVEQYVAHLPDVNRHDNTFAIHRSIAGEHHCQEYPVLSSPDIQTVRFLDKEHREIFVCFNHSWETRDVRMQFPEEYQGTALKVWNKGSENRFVSPEMEWTFPPKEVEVFIIDREETQ